MEQKYLDQLDEIIIDLCHQILTARHGEVKIVTWYFAKILTKRAELRSLCGYDVNKKAMDSVDEAIAEISGYVREIYSSDDFALAENMMEILIARAKLGSD